MIDILVNDCLHHESNIVKAVACFDLGEFSKYNVNGKRFLEKKNVRSEMTRLMADSSVSAEVKKEAITCYQKLLMNSWSSGKAAGTMMPVGGQ